MWLAHISIGQHWSRGGTGITSQGSWDHSATGLSLHVVTSTCTVKEGLREESKINNNEEVFPCYLNSSCDRLCYCYQCGSPRHPFVNVTIVRPNIDNSLNNYLCSQSEQISPGLKCAFFNWALGHVFGKVALSGTRWYHEVLRAFLGKEGPARRWLP